MVLYLVNSYIVEKLSEEERISYSEIEEMEFGTEEELFEILNAPTEKELIEKVKNVINKKNNGDKVENNIKNKLLKAEFLLYIKRLFKEDDVEEVESLINYFLSMEFNLELETDIITIDETCVIKIKEYEINGNVSPTVKIINTSEGLIVIDDTFNKLIEWLDNI